jgi:hypothetical protein
MQDYRKLRVWQGARNELESQLLLAFDLKFIPKDIHVQLGSEIVGVRQQLTLFIQALNDERS